MKIIVCVDDKMGISFNGKRQSQDRVLYKHLVDMAESKGVSLRMSEDSAKLFPDSHVVRVGRNFPIEAFDTDYCFIEGNLPKCDKVNEVVLCRWNRVYPSDEKLGIDLKDFKLVYTQEFVGSSHEKISLEFYKRV